jgi:hypothetical protein
MQGPAITTNLDQFHQAKYENKVLLLHKSDDQGTNVKYPYNEKILQKLVGAHSAFMT